MQYMSERGMIMTRLQGFVELGRKDYKEGGKASDLSNLSVSESKAYLRGYNGTYGRSCMAQVRRAGGYRSKGRN